METNFTAFLCLLPALWVTIHLIVTYSKDRKRHAEEIAEPKWIPARMPTPEEEAMMPDYMPEPKEPFPLLLMRLGLEMVIVTENENEE